MSVYSQVENFLKSYCPSPSPLLLALSGGADSLCLFHCLLTYREKQGLPFHIAHVDHGWREESQREAEGLRRLADQHQVPFHLKRLDPTLLEGNLEAACREERYLFFYSLHLQHSYQGVVTGHHQNDQAETVFKRILEGSHWSRWGGLQPESLLFGVRVLRPLLEISKKDIQATLAPVGLIPFDDPTNRQLAYLRARFRESFFPRLNQEFGKEVQGSLIEIREEAMELTTYFEEILRPLLNDAIRGPWGVCLDLQGRMPRSCIEIKFLLRQLCRSEGFFLSRTIIDRAAQALVQGSANLKFEMGTNHLLIDRERLFILTIAKKSGESNVFTLSPGSFNFGEWQADVAEASCPSASPLTSWKEGWRGTLTCYLPRGNYQMGWGEGLAGDRKSLKKLWGQAKIPSFLTPYFPLIKDETGNLHEFLTGKRGFALREGEPCLKIMLTYLFKDHRVRK